MSTPNIHTLAPSPLSKPLTNLWRLPILTVARFTLRSYTRSGWILGDIVFIWLLYAIFYLEFGGNVAYFFGTAGQGLGVLAILSTVVMTQRALSARVYLPLARLTSRSSYIRGVILATGLLRIPSFLLLMVLAMGYHRFSPPRCGPTCIDGATFSNIATGTIGLLVNCIIISTLTVLLSRPIATRVIQIVFLVWIVAVLYSNTNLGVIATYLSWTHIPLAPIAACYNFSTSHIAGYEIAMLLLAIGYIIGLTLLAEFSFKRRDLILL